MTSDVTETILRQENVCLCGEPAGDVLLRLDDNTSIRRCPRCHLVRTYPYPYDSELTGVEISNVHVYERDEALYRRFAQKLVQVMQAHLPAPARIVDVGCGPGIFSDEIRRAGYEVIGLDLDEAAIRWGQGRGFPVQRGTLTDRAISDLDGIVASHTMEHILRLNSALQCFHQCLRSGGMLFLSQPNYNSWMARWKKEQWPGWVPSQHHWHFDATVLTRILRQNGFQVLEVRQDRLHEPWPPLSLIAHPRTYVRRLLKAAISRMAPLLGQGDGLTYVAVKLS